MEINNLPCLEPENEAAMETLSAAYSNAKERIAIDNMVRRKINESQVTAVRTKQAHKYALLPKKTFLGYAAAAMISIFAISSVFYITNDNPAVQKHNTITSAVAKAQVKQDPSKYNKDYIKSENLLVYQF